MMRTVALRRIATCLDGNRIPLNREQRADMQGDVPYWGSGGVLDYVGRKLFDESLVLLGEDGAPFFDVDRDVAYFVEGPIWVNNHIHVLRPSSSVDGRYLAYALNVTDYGRYISGSTRDKLTQEAMWSIEINLPELNEQRRIADFLDAETARIDALASARARQQALIEERWEAVIVEELSASAAESVELRRLGVSVTTGPFGTVFSASEYQSGGVPMINPLHVREGVLVPDPDYTVSREAARRLKRHQLRPGDLVVGRKGDLGRAAVVGIDQDGWICGSDCIALHVEGSRVQPRFLSFALRSQWLRSQLLARSLAATMPSLSEGNLLQLPLPAVSRQRQEQIVACLEPIEAWTKLTASKMKKQLVALNERRQALITAAVTGQFDVTTARGADLS